MALTWTQWPWYLNRTQILSWCTTIPKWAFYVNYFKRYRQTDTHTHIHTLRKHYNATVRWTPINFLYLLFIKSSIFKNKKYFFKFQNCRVGLEPNACYNNERIVSTGEMLLTRKNNFQQTLKKKFADFPANAIISINVTLDTLLFATFLIPYKIEIE